MSTEVKKEIQLEIGHVLFIDIIGYSNLLITKQSELLRRLSDIVRETEQFRAAERRRNLWLTLFAANWRSNRRSLRVFHACSRSLQIARYEIANHSDRTSPTASLPFQSDR